MTGKAHGDVAVIGWHEGGAGLVASWLEDACGLQPACFIHPDSTPPALDALAIRRSKESRFFEPPENGRYRGLPLIAATDWPDAVKRLELRHVLVAVSEGEERVALIRIAEQAGLTPISAIHPTALVLPEAILHQGVILHARAVVGYRAEVHPGVILNTGAVLDHHGVMKQGSAFDPRVVAAGNVTLEEYAQVHTGAVIINKIRIGARAVVGAGAVVINDVLPGATVVGNPARAIRRG